MASDEDLPPDEERLSLREAPRLFEPPTTKKALESLIARGNLQVWREPPSPERPDRSSRVVTTREALEAYARSPTSRRRLRGADEPPALSASPTAAPLPTDLYVLVGRDIYELRAQLHETRAQLQELRQRIEALERTRRGADATPAPDVDLIDELKSTAFPPDEPVIKDVRSPE